MTPPGLLRPPVRDDGLIEIVNATWPSLAPALALLVIYFAAAGF